MLFDENRSVRAKAVDLILSAKKPGKRPRKFIKPDLKFNSKKYNEMIDWKNIKINDLKIKMQINKKLTEPCVNGVKRIDPRDSLAVFIEEFTNKDIRFKKGDFLLCGSLTEPYKIKKRDNI